MIDSKKLRGLGAFLALGGVLLLILEEAFVASGAGWRTRQALALASACVDLAFSIELALLAALAAARGGIRRWLLDEGGWLAALASLPPLILVSGPFLFGFASGVHPLAPVAGAMGGVRVLRSLRLLRAFRLLRLADHLPPGRGGRPARMLPALLLAVLGVPLAFETASALGFLPDARAAFADSRAATVAALAAAPGPDAAETAASVDPSLLLVRVGGTVVYTRHAAADYKTRFGPDSVGMVAVRGAAASAPPIEAWFDLGPENRALALDSLAALLAALGAFAVVWRAGAGDSGRPAAPSTQPPSDSGTRIPRLPSARRPSAGSIPRAERRGAQASEADRPTGREELEGLLARREEGGT